MNSVKIFCLAILLLWLPIVLTAAPSPWDSWRSGYTNFEHGEMLREKGSYTQALKFFERARKNYLAVRSARPDWNQRVIADRLRDCDRQISELRRLLNENKPASSSPSVSGTTAGSYGSEQEQKRNIDNVKIRSTNNVCFVLLYISKKHFFNPSSNDVI